MSSIINSNPQNRVKDSYLTISSLDLTLRCNGEEPVEVIDALGNRVPAGITAPTVAPTITAGAAGTFPASSYWAYQYVYAAVTNFPLIQNAVTGGGSPAPRSNPSPPSAPQGTATTIRAVACTTSQEWWVSHIWIYRTLYFTTAQQALDSAIAGNCFFIASIANDPNKATVSFNDDGSLAGQEQIENDNFKAPQFLRAVYSEPFIYGFGNDEFITEVNVSFTGVVTITNPTTDKWYSGRNGQFVRLDGITIGGTDNHGLFYFKFLTNSTAQLYTDIGLTQIPALTIIGTTKIHILGPSTRLYFSKPNNPLSWGSTDAVGDLLVPAPNFIQIGGRRGISISVIPTLSLLKLDIEGPIRSYTFNLKNAGTTNFAESKRIISDAYSVSNHSSQFTGTLPNGQSLLWSMDARSFAIIACDGSSQFPISSQIYKTLRNLSPSEQDRIYFHGVYAPKAELNCMFLKTVENGPNRLVYQHAPTGYWGEMDLWDVTCSAQFLDPNSRKAVVYVGTNDGLIGELFADGYYWNWLLPTMSDGGSTQLGYGVVDNRSAPEQFLCLPPSATATFYAGGVPIKGIIGNWVTQVAYKTNPVTADDKIHRVTIGKITGIYSNQILSIGTAYQVDQATGKYVSVAWPSLPMGYTGYYYIGLIEMTVARNFDGSLPSHEKKIEQLVSNWGFVDDASMSNYPVGMPVSTYEAYPGLTYVNACYENNWDSLAGPTFATIASRTTLLPNYPQPKSLTVRSMDIEMSRNFCVVFRDRHYFQTRLFDFEVITSLSDDYVYMPASRLLSAL